MIDLNGGGDEPPRYDLGELKRRLAETAYQWVTKYFPRGRIDRRGIELRIANIRGDAPSGEGSCVIHLKGEHAGCWFDHSEGGGGDQLSTLEYGSGLRGRPLFDLAAEIGGATSRKSNGNGNGNGSAAGITHILLACVASQGSLVETYLNARGVQLPNCRDILFHRSLAAGSMGHPAMVARIRDPETGQLTGGIHRTYLSEDGTGKADIDKPKMMLGPSAGVVMLQRMTADGELGVGEGIESSLAGGQIYGVPVWAALSAGALQRMKFPPGLKKLHIFADRGQAGEDAAHRLSARCHNERIVANVYYPIGDDDFCDDLQNGRVPPPQAEIVEFIPPEGSIADLLAAAHECPKGDSPELEKVLRACTKLDAIKIASICQVLKNSTGFGTTVLQKQIDLFRKRAVATIDKSKPWEHALQRWESGEPKANMHNVLVVLQEDPAWRGVIEFNEFSGKMMVKKRCPFEATAVGPAERPWTDTDTLRMTAWIQQHGVDVRPQHVRDALPVWAEEFAIHPVRQYLEGTALPAYEDSPGANDATVPGIDHWLTGYCGVEDDPYVRAIGARTLIAAVDRVMSPGCKADEVLILEGRQGTGKSRAVKALFEPWYSDDLGDFKSKDSQMQLLGVWGFELSELAGMDRSEVRDIKQWLARQTDHFRPPYGQITKDVSRQCVFIGTVNDAEYLRDATGGRRFWPVHVNGKIDVDGLLKAKHVLWGEAYSRWQMGERHFLHEKELVERAEEEQELRYQGDPWAYHIQEHINSRFGPNVWHEEGHCDELRVEDILRDVLLIELRNQTKNDMTRVGNLLARGGWSKLKVRVGKAGQGVVWRRERPKNYE